jgi:YD repeat-containing protein
MRTASGGAGMITTTYDLLNRPNLNTDVHGVTLDVGYDANGNRPSLTDTQGGTTTIYFDTLNRQTREDVIGNGGTLRFDYQYNNRDREWIRRYADLGATQLIGSTAFGHDALGRLTYTTHCDGLGATLHTESLGYDVANRLTSKSVNGAPATTYGNDLTGNRNANGFMPVPNNYIQSNLFLTYGCNSEGNITSKSKIVGSESWAYQYDHENKLIAFTRTEFK